MCTIHGSRRGKPLITIPIASSFGTRITSVMKDITPKKLTRRTWLPRIRGIVYYNIARSRAKAGVSKSRKIDDLVSLGIEIAGRSKLFGTARLPHLQSCLCLLDEWLEQRPEATGRGRKLDRDELRKLWLAREIAVLAAAYRKNISLAPLRKSIGPDAVVGAWYVAFGERLSYEVVKKRLKRANEGPLLEFDEWKMNIESRRLPILGPTLSEIHNKSDII